MGNCRIYLYRDSKLVSVSMRDLWQMFYYNEIGTVCGVDMVM